MLWRVSDGCYDGPAVQWVSPVHGAVGGSRLSVTSRLSRHSSEYKQSVRCPHILSQPRPGLPRQSDSHPSPYKISQDSPNQQSVLQDLLSTWPDDGRHKNFHNPTGQRVKYFHIKKFLLIIGFPIEVENQDRPAFIKYSTCQSTEQWARQNITILL